MLRKIQITAGDTRFFRVPLLLGGRVRTPVAGWTFFSTAKASEDLPDAQALFQKTTANGDIAALDATTVFGKLAAADTVNAAPGIYYWDVKAVSPQGDPYTLETVLLVIAPRITRAA